MQAKLIAILKNYGFLITYIVLTLLITIALQFAEGARQYEEVCQIIKSHETHDENGDIVQIDTTYKGKPMTIDCWVIEELGSCEGGTYVNFEYTPFMTTFVIATASFMLIRLSLKHKTPKELIILFPIFLFLLFYLSTTLVSSFFDTIVIWELRDMGLRVYAYDVAVGSDLINYSWDDLLLGIPGIIFIYGGTLITLRKDTPKSLFVFTLRWIIGGLVAILITLFLLAILWIIQIITLNLRREDHSYKIREFPQTQTQPLRQVLELPEPEEDPPPLDEPQQVPSVIYDERRLNIQFSEPEEYNTEINIIEPIVPPVSPDPIEIEFDPNRIE